MPLYDYHCECCGFTEERFVRKPLAEYDPGVCPNLCQYTNAYKDSDGAMHQELLPKPLTIKFNPGNLAKPIYRGYGWHHTDYSSTGPK